MQQKKKRNNKATSHSENPHGYLIALYRINAIIMLYFEIGHLNVWVNHLGRITLLYITITPHSSAILNKIVGPMHANRIQFVTQNSEFGIPNSEYREMLMINYIKSNL